MGYLSLENVSVEFPILNSRSLKSTLLKSRQKDGEVQNIVDRKNLVIQALADINITLKKGDRLGLIGHNGAGKTTLLKTMAGVYPPSAGRVFSSGKISPMFNTSLGMDPEDTGYENIKNMAIFFGLTPTEIEQKLPEIEDFCELGTYLNLPVHTYSSGMATRLTFAVATCVEPDILLLDEGLGAGDARFTEKAKKRVDNLIEKSSLLVVASHATSWIYGLCNKAVLLEHGKQVAMGDVREVVDYYENILSVSMSEGNAVGGVLAPKKITEVEEKPQQEQLKLKNKIIECWDEENYLNLYPDVASAVLEKTFESGLDHYLELGIEQRRLGSFNLPTNAPPNWDENEYILSQPDVLLHLQDGIVDSGYDHFWQEYSGDVALGKFKAPFGAPTNWDEQSYLTETPDALEQLYEGQVSSGLEYFKKHWSEESYLSLNPDVAEAVATGTFSSGLEHYILFGKKQNRET